MFDIAQIFVSQAWAQDAAAPAAAGQASSLASFLPLILIFAVFYVLIIRPQQKRLQEQETMVKALKRGDRVITSGGIHGKISKLEDDVAILEIAEGVEIKIVRAQIQGLVAKTEVAASGDEKKV